MKKKVLLLVPPHERLVIRGNYCSNESKANYYTPPVDLIMLSAVLRNKYEISLIDAIAGDLNENKTLNGITEIKPDIIVFVTGGISEDSDEKFLKKLKDNFREVILIGSGDILLFDFENYLKKWHFLDAILLDYTSFDILSFLDKSSEEFDTIAYRKKDKIIYPKLSNKKGKIYGDFKNREYMKIGIPMHELFIKFNYRIPHGMYRKFAMTIISFGCPYVCSFCPMQRLVYKYRDIEEVIEEMKYIVSLGIKEVLFFDQTFAARRKDAIHFCRRVIEENINIKWICMSRVDVTDYELLKLMKRAGCHTIQYGVESSSDSILKNSNKGVGTDKYFEVFNNCRKLGIKTLGHFIVGLPGETDETVKATVDYAIKLGCDYASFNIAEAPLGTKLRDEAVKKGLIDNSKQASFLAFQAYIPEGLNFEQIIKWRDYAVKRFYLRPGYLFKKLFSVRTMHEFLNNLKEGIALLRSAIGKFSYKKRVN